MDSLPLASPQVKVVMMIVGLALGVRDVQQSSKRLDEALEARSARAIGEQMFIADPFFVAKAWRDHLAACGQSAWCYVPPPAPPKSRSVRRLKVQAPDLSRCNALTSLSLSPHPDSAPSRAVDLAAYRECLAANTPVPASTSASGASSSKAWWRTFTPVLVARIAVFPVAQTGWTLFRQGWTARVIFVLSILAALVLVRAASERSDSLPGAVVGGVAIFLIVSIVFSVALNLLLRGGNMAAGYWGVLVALAAGIYFTLELVSKIRELLHATGMGKRD